MIDCPDCKGAGKVATSYREVVQPKSSVEKKEPFSIITSSIRKVLGKAWRWFAEYWTRILYVAALLLMVGSVVWFFIWVYTNDNTRQAIKAKETYLFVQYDDANKVERCYTSPARETVSIVGNGIVIYIHDITNPGNIPSSVGVSDLSKCLRYNQ